MSMRSYQSSRGRGRGGGRGGVRGQGPPAQPGPPVQYAFPHMDVAEIMEDMAVFGQPFTETMLKAPTSEDVHAVFSFFLREIYGDDIDAKLETMPECFEILEYPDIHEESPGIYHFVRAVYEMLCTAQYPDFTIHDLITPTRTRFRWQISALLNMAKFRASRLDVYDTLASGEDECVAQHAALQTDIHNLDEEIATIEAVRTEEEPEVEENRRVIPELMNQLSQLRKQQIELTSHTSEQKTVLSGLNDKVADLKLQILSVKNEVAEKQAKVVASPDRAMAEIAAMEEKLRSIREKTEDLRRKKVEKQARTEAVRAANEILKISLKATEECLARNERKKEMDEQVAKSMAKKAEIEKGMRADEESLSILQKSIDAMQGRRLRQEQQWEEMKQQMAQDTEKIEQKNVEAQRHSQDVEQKVEAYKQRTKDLMATAISGARKIESEMKSLDAKHQVLLENCQTHDEQLREAMEMFTADNKKSLEDLKENSFA